MYFEIIKGFTQYFITKTLAQYFDVFRFPSAPTLSSNSFFQPYLSDFWLLREENEYRLWYPQKEKVIELEDNDGNPIGATKSNNPIILQKKYIDLKENIFVKTNNQLVEIRQRLLPIEGTCNFRDLGGYFNENNNQILCGKLFRADYLADLTLEGKKQLEQIQIKTIVDFRSTKEITKKPDKIPNSANYIHLPIKQAKQESFVKKALLKGKGNNINGKEMMQEIYFSIAFNAVNQLSQFFKLLQYKKNYPIVFHCTAGKDRTGFTAALLLSILGIDRKTIIHDYLLSNYYRHEQNHKYAEMGKYFLKKEIINQFLIVHPDYLEKVFNFIIEKYGSISNYMETVFSIDTAAQNRIRKLLLKQA